MGLCGLYARWLSLEWLELKLDKNVVVVIIQGKWGSFCEEDPNIHTLQAIKCFEF